MKEPLPSPFTSWASRRMRRILAFVGLFLILVSILLLISMHRTPQHELLRYDPPATLFAPPGVNP